MKTPAKEVCSEKDRHASEADAYAAASHRVGNRHDKPAALRAYLCPDCRGWHLTKHANGLRDWSFGQGIRAARARQTR
jgi:hypothetical protein